eukprot:scaffold26963_cov155-Skeletonema_dohrnii-CCMP3373.AAC.17
MLQVRRQYNSIERRWQAAPQLQYPSALHISSFARKNESFEQFETFENQMGQFCPFTSLFHIIIIRTLLQPLVRPSTAIDQAAGKSMVY